MDIIRTKSDLREIVNKALGKGQTIGLIPTMGFLHEGHLSLMRRARRENDLVIVSVFVNPTQFGPNEDLEAYPRDSEKDITLMRSVNADIAFFPDADDIYPYGYATYVQVEGAMAQTLCGRSRPIHFRGVTTIVSKLFHLAKPHRAYFGQKDAQQVAIIAKMIQDLDFDIELVVCPIIREADGLAMSSRNRYLTSRERSKAKVLSQALHSAQAKIKNGERSAAAVIQNITERIASVKPAEIDYVSVMDAVTLNDVQALRGKILIAVAVIIGRTRLIDNVQFEV
ncbi:MAG: pantoate--beta-alanine ligase [Desulfobacteraceae bacterium]|nr:pantoate--beta-alanine ligase [Desulfobacteraceae bacterium]